MRAFIKTPLVDDIFFARKVGQLTAPLATRFADMEEALRSVLPSTHHRCIVPPDNWHVPLRNSVETTKFMHRYDLSPGQARARVAEVLGDTATAQLSAAVAGGEMKVYRRKPTILLKLDCPPAETEIRNLIGLYEGPEVAARVGHTAHIAVVVGEPGLRLDGNAQAAATRAVRQAFAGQTLELEAAESFRHLPDGTIQPYQ